MKAKKALSLILAAAMAYMAVIAASAERSELTEEHSTGNTEVIAHISGTDPGDVTYIISIPDVVDFGELHVPDSSSSNDYKLVDYQVTLEMVNGLDPDTQNINVYVKDQGFNANGDQHFYIANQSATDIKFSYDVFDVSAENVDDTTVNINRNTATSSLGFLLHSFQYQGEKMNGSLRIDQLDLLSYPISQIVGDYSGFMVFTSMIEDK